MSTMVTGLFDSPRDAGAAIRMLEAKGVKPDAISLLANESVSREAFEIDTHSKLPEGTAIGASGGGAIGALIAGFTAVGTLATGGAGLIAAGPLVAALMGAGAGAAGGGVVGAAIGAAVPEHEVKVTEDAIAKGSVLVGVECGDDETKSLAEDIFERLDARKVATA